MSYEYRALLIGFILLCFSANLHSQNVNQTIDSLQHQIKLEANDSLKDILRLSLINEYRHVNHDSALFYHQLAVKNASSHLYIKKRLALTKAMLLFDESKFKQSNDSILLLVPFFEQENNSKDLANIHNALGINYQQLGDYQKAVEEHLKSLTFSKKDSNNFMQGASYANLAFVYFDIKEYDKSLEYYRIAKQNFEKIQQDRYVALMNGNMANVFADKKDYDSTIVYANKALAYFNSMNQKRLTSYSLVNLGTAYKALKDYAKAENYYKEAIAIKQENKESKDAVITQTYLADLYLQMANLTQAERVANEAYETSMQLNLMPEIERSSAILAKIYTEQKDFTKANYFLALNNRMKDSLFASENAKEIFKLQTRYETAEKENKILQQTIEIEQKDRQVHTKNVTIVGILSLVGVLSLLGFLWYKQQQIKRQKQLKEAELQLALNTIENQNKLQEQRLAISRDLHDNIGAQLTFIISSIDTTRQQLGQANEQLTHRLGNINLFAKDTIHELRDTIWAMNNAEISIDDLKARILNFINQASIAKESISFQCHVDLPKGKAYVLNSKNGMNVYRVLQEAIHNAIKHANASKIDVSITKEGEAVLFKIADNGIGFNKNEVEQGNGLQTMKSRAEELPAMLSVSSDEYGTIVQLKVPEHVFKN